MHKLFIMRALQADTPSNPMNQKGFPAKYHEGEGEGGTRERYTTQPRSKLVMGFQSPSFATERKGNRTQIVQRSILRTIWNTIHPMSSLTLAELAKHLGATLQGDPAAQITGGAGPQDPALAHSPSAANPNSP